MKDNTLRHGTTLTIEITPSTTTDIPRVIDRIKSILDSDTAMYSIDIRSKITGGQNVDREAIVNLSQDENSKDNPDHRSRHRARADQ